ncbi:MAG: hypothetical protein AAGA64_13240 [Bacteroidota bacterium]
MIIDMYFQGQHNNNAKTTGKWSKFVAFVVLFSTVVLFSPEASGQRTVIKDKNKNSRVILSDKNVYRSTRSSLGNNFNIEYKGDIEINDTDTDVTSISPGGYLEISKTTFGSKRAIVIEPRGGTLKRQYYEGRKEVEWNPDGKEWLAEILPDVVRSTGFAAESRVNRYFKKGGVDAVLDEVSRLESDYVRSIYGKLLLDKDELTVNQLAKSIEELSDEISSDYYLAQMLKDNSSKFLKQEKTAEAYFSAVRNISSDYYATVVLKKSLERYTPTATTLAKIMVASRDIDSDYYQASLLSEVLELEKLDGPMIAEIIETTKDISSDYYQSQILKKAMDLDNLSSESFEELIEAISDVSSDYYMASVFSSLLDNELDNDVQKKIIILVDDKMSSDHYASSILSKMLEEQDLDDEAAERLMEAVGDINSSHYASSILKKAASRDDLSKFTVLALIKSVEDMDSDYYKSQALQELAPHVRKSDDSDLRKAYRSAADQIRSDTYYGRAIRAID